MEDRKNHRIRVAVGISLVLALISIPALADEHDEPFTWPTDVVVESNPHAVIVEADAEATSIGSAGTGGGSGCWLEIVGTISDAFVDSFEQQWGNPHLMPYLLWCDDEMRGLVWLDTSDGDPAPVLDPETIAMHVRDEIPVPDAQININPERGLVGVDSWFWIEGYDGAPIQESTEAFGQIVQVEAQVTGYEWSFGDGETLGASTVGQPYPQRSDIRHVYERSSAGLESGYTVEVLFAFDVRYRVGGGGWTDLPGITRVASTSYPVRESQAVIQQ